MGRGSEEPGKPRIGRVIPLGIRPPAADDGLYKSELLYNEHGGPSMMIENAKLTTLVWCTGGVTSACSS